MKQVTDEINTSSMSPLPQFDGICEAIEKENDSFDSKGIMISENKLKENDLDVISKLLDSKLVTSKETLANDIAESVAANVQRSLSSFNWDSF